MNSFHAQIQIKQISSCILPFLHVTVVYNASWLSTSKAKVGAIFLTAKSPHGPLHQGGDGPQHKGCWVNGPLIA